MKYRKKPVVIEAIQFIDTPERLEELSKFIDNQPLRVDYKNPNKPVLKLQTLEGEHIASVGDYIIKGVKGEFYPCKPDIFEMTYEPVNCYMEELQSVYNQITNILKENNVLMNITPPRPYLIKKDDEERINAEAEDLLKEGKIEEYNLKMKEKEAYKLYFDEAYKYE